MTKDSSHETTPTHDRKGITGSRLDRHDPDARPPDLPPAPTAEPGSPNQPPPRKGLR